MVVVKNTSYNQFDDYNETFQESLEEEQDVTQVECENRFYQKVFKSIHICLLDRLLVATCFPSACKLLLFNPPPF